MLLMFEEHDVNIISYYYTLKQHGSESPMIYIASRVGYYMFAAAVACMIDKKHVT